MTLYLSNLAEIYTEKFILLYVNDTSLKMRKMYHSISKRKILLIIKYSLESSHCLFLPSSGITAQWV